MKFKRFFKRYGIIGYPIEKITDIINSVLNKKSTEFDKKMKKEIDYYNNYYNNKILKLKDDNISNDELQELEKKYINEFINIIEIEAFNIYMDIDTTKTSKSDENMLIRKYSDLIKTLEKIKNDNK